MIAAERETVVTLSDADDVVRISTGQRSVVARLRSDARVTITRTHRDRDGGEWVDATVSKAHYSPMTGFKARRAPASAAQREALAAGRAIAAGPLVRNQRSRIEEAAVALPEGAELPSAVELVGNGATAA